MKDIAPRNDTFAPFCGIKLEECKNGFARSTMKVEQHHKNGIGTVHGGALFTLADYTFAAAANSRGTDVHVVVAINAQISYMKAVTEGILTAIAEEIKFDTKVPVYIVKIFNEKKELVAVFNGMGYKKEVKK
ncbi:MAG: PaaI family thioesterase [Candidatus Omnitrophica bacterium]|nr:PaaI family thioesterase [Candidatus Omnitrophota bacterium]